MAQMNWNRRGMSTPRRAESWEPELGPTASKVVGLWKGEKHWREQQRRKRAKAAALRNRAIASNALVEALEAQAAKASVLAAVRKPAKPATRTKAAKLPKRSTARKAVRASKTATVVVPARTRRGRKDLQWDRRTSLARFLSGLRFSVTDLRSSGGCLWVVATRAEFSDVKDVLATRNVAFRFATKGGKATRGQAGWYTQAKD